MSIVCFNVVVIELFSICKVFDYKVYKNIRNCE